MCPHRGISLFISKFLESGNLCQPFCTFYLFPSIDTSGSLAPSTLYKKYSVPNIPTVICWCCSNEMVGMIINRGHALVAKKTNLNDQNKKRRHTQKPDITDLPEEKIRGKIHIVIRRYVKKKKIHTEKLKYRHRFWIRVSKKVMASYLGLIALKMDENVFFPHNQALISVKCSADLKSITCFAHVKL